MEMTETPVQRPKNRRWTGSSRRWRYSRSGGAGSPSSSSAGATGSPAGRWTTWRKSIEQGLADRGELVPKSQVVALQKKVEELEKALGRKALENEVLKKFFELKGLRLPEGI